MYLTGDSLPRRSPPVRTVPRTSSAEWGVALIAAEFRPCMWEPVLFVPLVLVDCEAGCGRLWMMD